MLYSKIKDDLSQAMLARDELKTSTLRMLISSLDYTKIEKNTDELEDKDVILVIQKELKKRVEAAAGFKSGGRDEQAQKEEAEGEVLKKYLPEQISDEELTKLVEVTINEVGASNVSDMGKVMGAVLGKVEGRADSSRVAGLVRGKLGI